ncbi:MAG: RNA polymerase sigma factor [Myxococcota bacterium]
MVTDEELIERWRAGDEEASGLLLARYDTPLHRFFANKVGVDTDDLVQRTVLACLEGSHRFVGRGSFRSFLFGIAYNVLRKHFERSHRSSIEFDVESVVDLGASPSTMLARGREHELMLQALRLVPVDYQVVLELYYWEDMKQREIAGVLEVPEATVRTRIRRGKERLKTLMAELGASSSSG